MFFRLFPSLNTTWNIILFILLCLVAAYILLYIANIIFIFSFKGMLNRDAKAVKVALSTKIDAMESTQVLLQKEGIELSEESQKSLKYLDAEDFVKLDSQEASKGMQELTSIDNELVALFHTHKSLLENNDFAILASLLNETNQTLKFALMRYNADVLGYNYWVRFPPFIYIYLLFRVKLKKTI